MLVVVILLGALALWIAPHLWNWLGRPVGGNHRPQKKRKGGYYGDGW
jgi:hypothetical protein